MDFKEFVEAKVARSYYCLASACVAQWYLAGGSGRYAELLAEAKQVIQVYKTRNKAI